MLNHITIMGRLTRDPELRRTGSGIAVASFCVAVDRDHVPEGGERETDFIDCVAWRQTGEFVSKYFTKGRMIVVSGRLQIRSWTDKDGNKRRTAEVVAEGCYFGDSKPAQEGNSQPQSGFQGQAYQPPQQNYQQTQNYGGYQAPAQQSYPQYNQQGFGGYQQTGYQNYKPTQGFHAPQQNDYPQLDGDDAQLPF